MTAAVELTIFPRLDCCVPDYTGKNKLLAELLPEVKQRLADRVHIEVVRNTTRAERLVYYERMLEALQAGRVALPFPVGPEKLMLYREAVASLSAGHAPSPSVLTDLRQISAYLFHVTPIIALNGRAVFITTVPTVAEIADAAEAVEAVEAGRAVR